MAEVKNICWEALERHCTAGETGRLDLHRGAYEGQIFTHDRLIVHAQLSGLEGVPALFRLFDWGDADTIWQAGITPDKPSLHLPMDVASVLYAEHQVELAELESREKERTSQALLMPEAVAAQAGGAGSVLKFYTVVLQCSDKELMPEGFLLSDKDKNSYVIGRSDECDIVLHHPTIDPLHCGIMLENGSVNVWDLGASSGVKINGTKVAQETLKVGDIMTLGTLDLHVRFQLRRPTLKIKPQTPGTSTGPVATTTTTTLPAPPPSKEIPKGPITYAKVTQQIKQAGKGESFFQKLGSLFGKKPK